MDLRPKHAAAKFGRLVRAHEPTKLFDINRGALVAELSPSMGITVRLELVRFALHIKLGSAIVAPHAMMHALSPEAGVAIGILVFFSVQLHRSVGQPSNLRCHRYKHRRSRHQCRHQFRTVSVRRRLHDIDRTGFLPIWVPFIVAFADLGRRRPGSTGRRVGDGLLRLYAPRSS